MRKLLLSVVITLGLFQVKAQEVITEAEAKKVALAIENSINEGNPKTLDSLWSNKLFSKRPALKGVQEEILISMLKKMNLSKVILNAINGGGHYKYIRFLKKGGSYCIKFRMFASNIGMNYHDMLLAKFKGKIKIEDMDVLLTDELLSETCGNTISSIISNIEEGKSEKALLKAFKSMEEITRLSNLGENQKAWALLNALPKEVREYKVVKTKRLLLASSLSES
jgi:hypothetical protein